MDYSHVVSLKHVGETLDLKVLRSGKVSESFFVGQSPVFGLYALR